MHLCALTTTQKKACFENRASLTQPFLKECRLPSCEACACGYFAQKYKMLKKTNCLQKLFNRHKEDIFNQNFFFQNNRYACLENVFISFKCNNVRLWIYIM